MSAEDRALFADTERAKVIVDDIVSVMETVKDEGKMKGNVNAHQRRALLNLQKASDHLMQAMDELSRGF